MILISHNMNTGVIIEHVRNVMNKCAYTTMLEQSQLVHTSISNMLIFSDKYSSCLLWCHEI